MLGDWSRYYTHRERSAGFRDAMERAHAVGWQPYERDNARDAASAEQQVRELLALAEPPTALFTLNNWITAGALRALRNLGAERTLPALVGFDDLDLGDLLDVSVIHHDAEEMGRLAATTALARIDGDVGPFRTVVVPSRLVVRGSGERPPV